MKINTMTMVGALGLMLVAVGASAEERAEQIVRDAARLAQVKKIALLPVVTQVRFDNVRDIPDPNRVSARVTAATRLAQMLEERMKGGKYTLLPPEAASLALKELGWEPTDIYVTKNTGTWSSPGEVMQNRKKDEAVLLTTRAAMKDTPDVMSLYRFTWHDVPDRNTGLASFKMAALAVPDVEKLKQVAEKTGADTLFLAQVAEMETHEGAAGISLWAHTFKSTRIHLHFTLVSASDGAVIWQARAKGMKSQQAGIFTGNRAYKAEDRKVIEAAVQAMDVLLEDLNQGTGIPTKPDVGK